MDSEWQQTSPGHFERRLDEKEVSAEYMSRYGMNFGREIWTVTTAISLDIPVDRSMIEAIREAWITLRYEQPNIASTVDRAKGVRNYTIASPAELHSWLSETFRVETTLSSEELLPRLTSSVKKPVIYVLPQSRELLFRCSHLISDGMGVLGFWDDLLSILSSPRTVTFGDEAKNLPPGFFIAFDVPQTTQKHIALAQNELSKYAFDKANIALPHTAADSPGEVRLFRTTLSESQTERIIRAAKDRKCTPTHLMSAALILATKKRSVGKGHYRGFIAFSPRSRLRPELRRFNVASYATGWAFLVEPGDFSSTVQMSQDFYQSVANNMDELLPCIRPLAVALSHRMRQNSADGPMPIAAPMLNSLGIIDSRIKRRYGEVEVKDFWVAVDTLRPEFPVYLYTWRGRMWLTVPYNVSYFTQEDIARFHKDILEILFAGLGLNADDL